MTGTVKRCRGSRSSYVFESLCNFNSSGCRSIRLVSERFCFRRRKQCTVHSSNLPQKATCINGTTSIWFNTLLSFTLLLTFAHKFCSKSQCSKKQTGPKSSASAKATITPTLITQNTWILLRRLPSNEALTWNTCFSQQSHWCSSLSKRGSSNHPATVTSLGKKRTVLTCLPNLPC